MKKLWSGIKTIKDKNGNISSDPTEISNIFKYYFVSIADCLSKNIPRTPESALDYLKNKNANSTFLSPVTHMEIENIISNLDSLKFIGPFSIPINFTTEFSFLTLDLSLIISLILLFVVCLLLLCNDVELVS